MSFSSQVKNELAHRVSRKSCCQVAELSAIIRMDGSLKISSHPQGYALRLSMENAAVARRAIKLFADIFGLRAEVTVRRSRLSKRNNYSFIQKGSHGHKNWCERGEWEAVSW